MIRAWRCVATVAVVLGGCTHFAAVDGLHAGDVGSVDSVASDGAVSDSAAADGSVVDGNPADASVADSDEVSTVDVATADTNQKILVEDAASETACGDEDEDGDGHAPRASGLTCAHDCDDRDPDAFPGQTKWFTIATDIVEFDYDCNGVFERRFTTAAKCADGPSGCLFVEGWLDAVPACGVAGRWLSACTKLATGQCGAATASIEPRVQECH